MKMLIPSAPARHVLVVLLVSGLASSCVAGASRDRTGQPSSAATETSRQGSSQDAGRLASADSKPGRCSVPLRVGVLLDKSGSVHENVVPQLSEGDLDELIALVNTCAGGEVAIGVLCNVSGDKPFVRLFIPSQVSVQETKASSQPADPFTELRRARAAAAEAATRRTVDEAAEKKRTDGIASFRAEALSLIQAPVSCTRTDIASGANRLLMYLAEAQPSPTVAAPIRVGVYVTDGRDNVRRQRLQTDRDLAASHLLVGGSPDAGVLAPLHPTRFESVPAALRWIQQTTSGR